jgi:hypothetical protein
MMAKGTYAGINLATPTSTRRSRACRPAPAQRSSRSRRSQPYGVRDCAFRDPAGNLVRIQELR